MEIHVHTCSVVTARVVRNIFASIETRNASKHPTTTRRLQISTKSICYLEPIHKICSNQSTAHMAVFPSLRNLSWWHGSRLADLKQTIACLLLRLPFHSA